MSADSYSYEDGSWQDEQGESLWMAFHLLSSSFSFMCDGVEEKAQKPEKV